MNCREFQDLLVIRACGILTEEEKKTFDSHLASCPACSKIAERLQAKEYPKEEKPPLPDWNVSWNIIASTSLKPRAKGIWIPNRWILIGPSLALIFLIGILAERWILRSETTPIIPFDPSLSVEEHLESLTQNIEMILTNAKNSRKDVEALSSFHDKIVQNLLDQTRILIAISNYRRDAILLESLKDVENMLISISNLRPEDHDAADQLFQILRDWTAQKSWILPAKVTS